MKIALITRAFPLKDGADTDFPATWELALALKRQGHELLVVTFGDNMSQDVLKTTVNGILVLAKNWDSATGSNTLTGADSFAQFSWQLARSQALFLEFEADMDAFQPDVVETVEFTGLGFFWYAARKYPLVVRCHGPMAVLMRMGQHGSYAASDVWASEAMELSTIAGADAVISLCNDLAIRLSERTGRSLSDFVVIRTPFSVDPDSRLPERTRSSFNSNANASADTRTSADSPLVFYFGQVTPHKGIDLLAEALPLVIETFPKATFLIAGPEPTLAGATEPYGNTLRHRLRELGVEQHVRFLGLLDHNAIKEYVQSTDICVIPSKYETACYACLEAVAYGGVVVATKTGGLPEYHIHGQSAWLVEPDSPQALAAGIIEVLLDPSKAMQLLQNGRHHVAHVCDPDLIATQSVAVYHNAIEVFNQSQASLRHLKGGSPEQAYRLLTTGIGNALVGPTIHEVYRKLIDVELNRAYQNGLQAGLAKNKQSSPSFLRLCTGKLRQLAKTAIGRASTPDKNRTS